MTRLCNLRCTYCHDWRAGAGQTMSFAVLARLVSQALRRFDDVDFVWHGGETTLMPIDFYRKAMAIEARFRRPGQQISNQLQTNATLLDDAWASFLRDNRFTVGVSIDGPPEIHDRYRRRVGGQGSFRQVMRGIERLQRSSVPFGVLMVVDEAALELGPDRIFDFILELGTRQVSLLAARPTNQPDAAPGTPTAHYVDAARMTPFLIGIYERWLAHGDRTIQIRELDNVRHGLATGQPAACTMAGGCLGNYFLVEPDGELAHCDLFVGDHRYTFGNIVTDGLDALLAGDRLRELQDENARAVDEMRARCGEFAICHGGCPHDRYTARHHDPRFSTGCCGQAELIAHLRRRRPDEERMIAAPTPAAPRRRRADTKLRVLAG